MAVEMMDFSLGRARQLIPTFRLMTVHPPTQHQIKPCGYTLDREIKLISSGISTKVSYNEHGMIKIAISERGQGKLCQ